MSAPAHIATEEEVKQAYNVLESSTASFYVSGDAAINLQCPEGTSGDWHAPAVFRDAPMYIPYAGDGPSALVNTNPWFGSDGLYDCTDQIKHYYPTLAPTAKIYAANHYRALLDKVLAFALNFQRVPAPVPLHDYLDSAWQVEGLMNFIEAHRQALPSNLAAAIDAWIVNLTAYEDARS